MIRIATAAFIAGLGLLPVHQPANAATEIQELTSPEGHLFWLVPEPTIPILSLEISFEGGASLDPPGQEGRASMVMRLLEEGAGDRDAVAFAETREALAARLSFSIGSDAAYVGATMLSENRDATVALLREAMAAPRFDDEAIERVRRQYLSSISNDATDPDAISYRVFRDTLLAGDPYGRPNDGTQDSIMAITRDDLIAGHGELLVANRARIGLVGDITAEEAGLLVDTLLADLPQTGPELASPFVPEIAGGVTIEEFDAPQSVVLFVQPGIDRHHPDFFAVYVLNHILGGGGFSSRLTIEVREKRGLTYGVYSYLALYDRMNLWMGGVSTANERVAESIDVIRAEWLRMRDDGVTAEELANAKRYMTGAYPLRFDSNRKIARILSGLLEDGLDTGYVTRRNGLIEAVTLEDVNRVAREWLDPDGLRFIVVGRPEGLSPVN